MRKRFSSLLNSRGNAGAFVILLIFIGVLAWFYMSYQANKEIIQQNLPDNYQPPVNQEEPEEIIPSEEEPEETDEPTEEPPETDLSAETEEDDELCSLEEDCD